MSAIQTHRCRIEYGGLIDVIPWYRQVLAVLFGFGVVLTTLWTIDQGSNQYMMLAVTIAAMVTLMLLFGVEIKRIELSIANGWFELTIPFTSTGQPERYGDEDNTDDDGE